MLRPRNFGNNTWRAASYNNRLQVTAIWDELSHDTSQAVRYNSYDWGAADNNGTLRGQKLYYGGPGVYDQLPVFNETFSYDALNRLASATDSGGWSRTFGHDRYGNMWVPSTTGIPLQGGTVATVNNYNAATNRINGASYDTAGNLISFTGSALTYDAENRITSASQSGIGSMYYFYDGAGRRVQEVSTYNVEKVFVYDAFGQMAAEYSLGAQSPPCTTCYIATDHLGSTRLVTDQNANVVARHDYLPFGEEIAANTGGRDGTFGTQDFVNQKFTGQERDVETGLDFFQARYFSAALGRFASPDTPLLNQDPSNPQSWNLYTYVRNNPLNFVDPDGHTCVTATGEPVAPDYPDVKWDNNDGYGCQTVVNVYGGYIDPIRAALSLSNILQLPIQQNSEQNNKRPDWLNNITAVFGYDQRIPLPSCLVNVALKTAANDLNTFTPGGFDVGKGALEVGSAVKYNQALKHAASRALTYPNKSSIFRGVMKTSGQLAKVADVLLLVNVDYALADGLIAEWRSMKRGECQ